MKRPVISAAIASLWISAAAAAQSQGTWDVMGTYLNMTVYGAGPAEDLDQSMDAAFDAVSAIDRQMSNYRADSELSRLNQRAGTRHYAVTANLFEVLSAAEHFRHLSHGAFDITAGSLVAAWGFYDPANAHVPPDDVLAIALAKTGGGRLTLRPSAGEVALTAGTLIDLGAIAKGYAVDIALETLAQRGIAGALVDLGGTVGVFGSNGRGQPWTIGIRNPSGSGSTGTALLTEGAIATSGNYERFFDQDGRRYAHIIDPRTGHPVEGVLAVTVVAPAAIMADALSTAAFVRAPGEGIGWLGHCIGVNAIAFYPGDSSGKLRVELAGPAADRVFDLERSDLANSGAVVERSGRGAGLDQGPPVDCTPGPRLNPPQ